MIDILQLKDKDLRQPARCQNRTGFLFEEKINIVMWIVSYIYLVNVVQSSFVKVKEYVILLAKSEIKHF